MGAGWIGKDWMINDEVHKWHNSSDCYFSLRKYDTEAMLFDLDRLALVYPQDGEWHIAGDDIESATFSTPLGCLEYAYECFMGKKKHETEQANILSGIEQDVSYQEFMDALENFTPGG